MLSHLSPYNQARGGSAIIVKDSIKYQEEQHIQSREIQLTLVCINSIKQKLIVGAICPPRYNLKTPDFVEFLREAGERFIVGGDYNAKHVDWGVRLTTTTKGRELRKAIQVLGCSFHSGLGCSCLIFY